MTSNNIIFAAVLLSVFSGCSPDNPSSTSTTTSGCAAGNSSCTNSQGPTAIPTSSTATLPLYIADPSTTGQWGYNDEPLVSVTICSPNHTSASQCQVISNILLDTGSFGLRVFGSAIASNVQLTQQTVNVGGETKNLAECAEFGIGADWGSVQKGDVKLGNQTATNISMQIIDINYGSIPSGCEAQCPDTDPCTAGYNGILGVGVFSPDCGTPCQNFTDDADNPGIYFGCDSTGCYDASQGSCGSDQTCMAEVPISEQVVNPVGSFASGANNGVSLTLPSIGAGGASAVSGTLNLGIGSPTSVTLFSADPNGLTDGDGSDFTTIFQGTTYGGSSSNPGNQNDPNLAFLDSGSNALYFPSGLAPCSDDPSFYCPGSTQGFSATIKGFSGSTSSSVSFSIGNADNLFNTGNSALNNLGGSLPGYFDWGLPFFFGRTIYVGLDGTTATVNSLSASGPFWAF